MSEFFPEPDVRASEPATHVVNSTHVIHKSTVRIPLPEIIALLKQRGLVIPGDAQLSASLDVNENVLLIVWSTENPNRQTAAIIPMPLVHRPDPDLTAPEPEDPEPVPFSGEGSRHWTDSTNATPIQDIQQMIRQQREQERALEPPNCPACGEPMVTSETARNAWACLNTACKSIRNWDKNEPVPPVHYGKAAGTPVKEPVEVPPALKRTEPDKIKVESAGRSATISLPGSVNLQELINDIKAAVDRQYAQRDLDAIQAGMPPAPVPEQGGPAEQVN